MRMKAAAAAAAAAFDFTGALPLEGVLSEMKSVVRVYFVGLSLLIAPSGDGFVFIVFPFKLIGRHYTATPQYLCK